MARKDVIEYYNKVCDQYHEFVEELKDFQELCNQGMVAPEIIEQAKQTIEPLKNNWQTLNYIIFLLNKPVKKKKQVTYSKQNKKALSNCKTDSEVYEENQQAINNLNNLKKDL